MRPWERRTAKGAQKFGTETVCRLLIDSGGLLSLAPFEAWESARSVADAGHPSRESFAVAEVVVPEATGFSRT